MKFPSLKGRSERLLPEQSDEEKMVLLKIAAHQFLGQKWLYFKKIKGTDQSGKLIKEKSLFEEMKATRSALKFTSKNTLRQYILAFQNCMKEIKSFAVTDEEFPELPDDSDGKVLKSMIPELDAVIIAWTPLKFLLPARQIREKGQASERHTEGLIAKLFFKVAGFYAVPENWDSRKLSFYLDRIGKDSPYQDVVQKLEPLKKNLLKFSEEFEQIKFGQAALSKDTTSDAGAFDDAMEIENFDSQVQTLYWHRFIYKAIESFLLKYYLTLVSSTASIHAVRYLSTVFEPALTHAIDMSVLFDGSFDTDISKKRFRKAFVELQQKRVDQESTKKIKMRRGVFEVYNYNLPLITRHGVPYEINKNIKKTSFWWLFVEKAILGKNRTDLATELNYTPHKKLSQSIADAVQQTEDLSNEKIKRTDELAGLKEGIEELNDEMIALDKAFRDENPVQKKEQLQQRNNNVEKGLQETANLLKKMKEEETGLIQTEEKLAQERDQLLEEEGTLKKAAVEVQATITQLEAELKEATIKKTALETESAQTKNENQGTGPDQKKSANQKIEALLADIERKSEKLQQARAKLSSVTEKLTTVGARRTNDIPEKFEQTQAKHTEILEKINEFDLKGLDQKKQKKQIQEEQIALEERDIRYAESKKKIDSTIKNSRKNLEKDAKTIENIVKKIADTEAAKAELQKKQQAVLEETKQKLEALNSVETRSAILIHISALLITSSQKRKEAWQKVLERFKQRLISDQKLAQSRVEEIKKESQKKLREMGKKASKLERLKQGAAVEDFKKEMEIYQQSVAQKNRQIIKFAKQEAELQKQRITQMFHKISKDKKRNDALSARHLFELICQMDEGEQFKNEFMDYLIQSTAQKYQQKLEPLYSNMFTVFNPTLLKKVSLVKALNKSGDVDGVRLVLSDEEQKGFNGIVQGIKNNLRKQKPDIFDCQAKIANIIATIDGLLNIKIDNPSLLLVLGTNFFAPKNPKAAKLHPGLIKRILELNHIMTPVAENSLILEGKENERDPVNRINTSLLRKLIAENQPA